MFCTPALERAHRWRSARARTLTRALLLARSGGSTPLHLAAMRGHADVARLLLDVWAVMCEQDAAQGRPAQVPDPRTIGDRCAAACLCAGGTRRARPLRPSALPAWRPSGHILLDLRGLGRGLGLGGSGGPTLTAPSSPHPRPHPTTPPHPNPAHRRYRHNPLKSAVDCGRGAQLAELLDPSRPYEPAQVTSPSAATRSPSAKKAAALQAASRAAGAKQPLGPPQQDAQQQEVQEQELIRAVAASPTAAAAPEPTPAPASPSAAAPSPAQRPSSRSLLAAAAATACKGAAPDRFLCPITYEVMQDPVKACDGQSYERAAIETWLSLGNAFFPGGRARVAHEGLEPDAALAAEIEAWRAAQQ